MEITNSIDESNEAIYFMSMRNERRTTNRATQSVSCRSFIIISVIESGKIVNGIWYFFFNVSVSLLSSATTEFAFRGRQRSIELQEYIEQYAYSKRIARHFYGAMQ